MRRYEKYKPSGVEWLGEIPEHWEVKRVKEIANYISRGVTPNYVENGFCKVINQATFSKGFFDRENAKFTSNCDKKALTKLNDILIASTGGGVLGKTFFIDKVLGEFYTDSHVTTIRANNKFLISKYLYYFFSINYDLINALLAKGSTNQTELQRDQLLNFKWCLPSLPEQTAIVNYLDTKTEAIDQKIELLTAKTAKYNALRRSLINETVCRGLNPNAQMKDSGIEWIGQIPAHWEVKRFKDVVAKYTTGGTPTTSNTDYFEGNNIWVCISDISESAYIYDSKIKLTDEAIRSLNIIKTPKGSLLFSFKLSIGKIAFVEKSVYTNEAILSIFPNKNIDLKYYYFMLPIFMLLAATENIYGAKMLNQKLIANALVVHPSIEEQSIIAEHLENKTAQIDTILTNISNQINKLKQLRKTLINGVVTGKIKVTED